MQEGPVSCGCGGFILLSVAANKLLSAHVISAAAEQNWSACGHLHTTPH